MAILVEKCQPFRVRMTCGHVEIRMMREATAGVEFQPEPEQQYSSVIVEAPYSACAVCEPSKRDMIEHQAAINAKYGFQG